MLKSKKILIAILLILLVFIVPNTVNAADEITATQTTKTSTGAEVKWSYELSGEEIINLKATNVAAITGELTIPSTIDGYKVTDLADDRYGTGAFQNATGLRKIVIPNTVNSIGNTAFSGCTGLRSVTIPSSVTTIGESSFENCTGLTSVIIPDSVTLMKTAAFKNCSGLKSITLSKNLSKLSNDVFEGCSGITEIVLPENLTTIGDESYEWYSPFNGCTALKFIKIPENVVSFGKGIFNTCNNLTIYAKEGSAAHTYAVNNEIPFEKIENWDKRNQTEGADITAPTVESMKIKYASVMDYYNKTTNDFRLPKGAEFTIIVAFSETLTGNTTPTLTIKCGTGSDIKLNNGVLSGENIVYTYKVTSADKGMISVVSLAGGDITDAAKNVAKLSVKELKVQYDGKYAFAEGNTGTNVEDDKNNEEVDKNEKPGETDKEQDKNEEKDPVTKTLQSIAITSAPTKTTYTVGEKFNSAGMKILATYSDGSKSYVTGDCTYSPSGKLTKNDTTITISYTENGVTKTAKQSIKIDTTIASGNIPYTGGTTIIIASVVAIMAVGAYIYKRNKDFKGI